MGLFRRAATDDVDVREAIAQRDASLELLHERIAELELALEDEGWQRLVVMGELEFSQDGLTRLRQMSRLMYLKNPLVQRAVNVQAFYTWAQGVQVHAEDETVNDVAQRFLIDPGNRRALTGAKARIETDVSLAVDGELFFVLFTNAVTGHVRIRTIVPDEIRDVICNPQDRAEPWFYVRHWTETEPTIGGGTRSTARKAYYPDWRYRPRVRASAIGDVPVMWDAPIYHVRTGGLAGMRRGVPETYAALDWARAYKSFLEDWASLVRSLSRFAWRVTTKNNKVAATKQKLATTVGTDRREGNPPPVTGAAFVSDDAMTLEAIPKTGATTSAEDGKGLRLMVAAAMNIPDTILSGDVDQGNLATSKTLDRPTELAFLSRQAMWTEVLDDLLTFVVQASVRATQGRLAGVVEIDPDGLEAVQLAGDVDPTINVTFPPILEHDVDATVKSIVAAAPHIPARTAAEMLLVALGADDVDELLELLDEERDTAAAEGVTEALIEALREARDAISA